MNNIETVNKEIDKIIEEFNILEIDITKGNTTPYKYKRYSELSEIKKTWDEIQICKSRLSENEILISGEDKELAEIAKEDSKDLENNVNILYKSIYNLLHPPIDEKYHNIIIEIRAGAGGEEAGIFARDLQRMYTLFSQRNGFKVSILDENENDTGGIKSVVLRIEGKHAYKKLIRESGVHRVQRIPVTESSGRIHTSTATVAVLPELEDIEIEIKNEDLIFEAMKASGPGGQSVNTTDSAIRLTHKPSGLIITCRESKSQLQNRDRAIIMLKSKLYQIEQEKQKKLINDKRSNQIGSGDRSEKIRTYNFQQDRVTDHRVKISWHNIPKIMDGFIEDIIEKTSNLPID